MTISGKQRYINTIIITIIIIIIIIIVIVIIIIIIIIYSVGWSLGEIMIRNDRMITYARKMKLPCIARIKLVIRFSMRRLRLVRNDITLERRPTSVLYTASERRPQW